MNLDNVHHYSYDYDSFSHMYFGKVQFYCEIMPAGEDLLFIASVPLMSRIEKLVLNIETFGSFTD